MVRRECASAPSLAAERAKPLSRAACPRSASRLRDAIERAGLSVRGVAAASGIAETILRDVCEARRPLTEEKLARLPVSVQRAFAALLLEDAEEAAPVSQLPLERHVLLVAVRHGEVAATVQEVLADGVVTTTEAGETLVRVRAELRAVEALERALLALRDNGKGR